MSFNNYLGEMKAVREEMYHVTTEWNRRPSLGEGLAGFWARAKFSLKLMFLEKELITFAVLQWACIALGYYLWVQMIGWIPEAAWERASQSDHASLGDFILLVWSFFCVGAVAFPLGILSGCMGAAHFLNRQGKASTIAECLKIVLPRAWPLWIFHWIDGWWTVQRILDRLPKKRGHRPLADKAVSEAVYYAWKTAAIGILPGLVTGRGLADAGRRSLDLVRRQFRDVVLLRAGYSAMCWIVGVAAYIGAICFFIAFPQLVNWKAPAVSQMHVFYFWAAVPILAATGTVLLFLRPIYVLSSCDIYADYVAKLEENLMLPPPPVRSRAGDTAFVAAALLCLAILAAMYFRTELGIMRGLAR